MWLIDNETRLSIFQSKQCKINFLSSIFINFKYLIMANNAMEQYVMKCRSCQNLFPGTSRSSKFQKIHRFPHLLFYYSKNEPFLDWARLVILHKNHTICKVFSITISYCSGYYGHYTKISNQAQSRNGSNSVPEGRVNKTVLFFHTLARLIMKI